MRMIQMFVSYILYLYQPNMGTRTISPYESEKQRAIYNIALPRSLILQLSFSFFCEKNFTKESLGTITDETPS